MALTGGAYVGPEGGITSTNRWLRFDFNDPNHRSLVILGGTSFTIGENIVTIDETTSYNLIDYISEEGADYYVFINAEGRVVASTVRTPADGYMFIGQFHTLCNGVPANQTGAMPAPLGVAVGDEVCFESYKKEHDADFANFYTKEVLSVTNGTQYSKVIIPHILAGFNTCDILPESVWCLNWHPAVKVWDGMVYSKNSNIASDIYLSSGSLYMSESIYGSNYSKLYYQNVLDSCSYNGKRLPNMPESMMISYGIPWQARLVSTPITGGHSNVNGERNISFIGVEDTSNIYIRFTSEAGVTLRGNTNPENVDGGALFGMINDIAMYILANGNESNSTSSEYPYYYYGPRYFNCLSQVTSSNNNAGSYIAVSEISIV